MGLPKPAGPLSSGAPLPFEPRQRNTLLSARVAVAPCLVAWALVGRHGVWRRSPSSMAGPRRDAFRPLLGKRVVPLGALPAAAVRRHPLVAGLRRAPHSRLRLPGSVHEVVARPRWGDAFQKLPYGLAPVETTVRPFYDYLALLFDDTQSASKCVQSPSVASSSL